MGEIKNMRKKIFFTAILLVSLLFKVEFLKAQIICGYSIYPWIETPHPYAIGGPHAPVVWSTTIYEPGATWLKVHFSFFDLNDEDYVDLKDLDGNLIERIKGIDVRWNKTSRFKVRENPDGTVSLWGPSIDRDKISIELHSISSKLAAWGFVIDEIGIGFLPIEEKIDILSICGGDDRVDIACYKGTIKYTRAEAVGRMLFKKLGDWVYCTGFLVSCTGTNHFLTNQHCIDSQNEVDTLDVRFHYQKKECGGYELDEYQTFYGDQYIKSHFTYDFCLLTLKNNPQNTYGFLAPLKREPLYWESIYIPQHPGGRPKEISLGNINNASVPSPRDGTPNTDFNYYCDTEEGSSGSPVIASSYQHQAIGIHHWGDCPNEAVKMSKIYPLIKNDIGCNTAPPAPSDLIPNPTGWNVIDLWWTDNSYNEDGFKIERTTSPPNFPQIATVGMDVSHFQDKNCAAGTTYYYRIKAYNEIGESSYSNIANATIPTNPPAAPSRLRALYGALEVQLTWQDNSNNESEFIIERKYDSEPWWQEIDRVEANTTLYYDQDIHCNQIHCYRVSAYNPSGYSSYSNEASVEIFCYAFSLKITPDKKIIDSGETVNYIYLIENKGNVDLINIEIEDDKFGKIATNITLKKGETKIFTKAIILIETTTNSATAVAWYYYKNKMKYIKTGANATVLIRDGIRT